MGDETYFMQPGKSPWVSFQVDKEPLAGSEYSLVLHKAILVNDNVP